MANGQYLDENGNPVSKDNAVTDAGLYDPSEEKEAHQEAFESDFNKWAEDTQKAVNKRNAPISTVSPVQPTGVAGAQQPETKTPEKSLSRRVGEFLTSGDVNTTLANMIGTNAALPQTQKGFSNAEQTQRGAYSNYQNIYDIAKNAPLQVQLREAGLTNYGPAAQQTVPVMGPNPFEASLVDPNVRAAQEQTQAMLQQIATSGMSPQMRAAYEQMSQGVGSDFSRQIQQIQQQQAARGMGSSGASLALQSQAAQAATNREAQMAQGIAGQEAQTKLAAMGQLGSLTNAQQAQLIGAAQARASGLQQGQQFGAKLQADIEAGNVQRQQQINMAQTEAANAMAKFNAGVYNTQEFQNKINSIVDRVKLLSGGASGMSDAASKIAQLQATQGALGGTAQGATVAGLLGLGQSALSDYLGQTKGKTGENKSSATLPSTAINLSDIAELGNLPENFENISDLFQDLPENIGDIPENLSDILDFSKYLPFG